LKKLKGERGWTMKAFLVKLQEGFKSLGFASQLGITLGLSLAMLAGVYGISQAMSPMQKVTQVVEVQTSVPANSSTPSNSTEKKEVADNKKEKKQTQETTETVTTEEPVVTTEERNIREVEQGIAAVERNTNRGNNETSISQQTKEATPTEVPTVTSVAETGAITAYRLKPLGNTGQEFETLEQALAWMKDQLDQSSKAQEAGKQDWVYSGRAYEIPWSDGTKTATVDLTKVEVQRPEPTTTDTTSAQTFETPQTDHL
jgi:hypothetical protein